MKDAERELWINRGVEAYKQLQIAVPKMHKAMDDLRQAAADVMGVPVAELTHWSFKEVEEYVDGILG